MSPTNDAAGSGLTMKDMCPGIAAPGPAVEDRRGSVSLLDKLKARGVARITAHQVQKVSTTPGSLQTGGDKVSPQRARARPPGAALASAVQAVSPVATRTSDRLAASKAAAAATAALRDDQRRSVTGSSKRPCTIGAATGCLRNSQASSKKPALVQTSSQQLQQASQQPKPLQPTLQPSLQQKPLQPPLQPSQQQKPLQPSVTQRQQPVQQPAPTQLSQPQLIQRPQRARAGATQGSSKAPQEEPLLSPESKPSAQPLRARVTTPLRVATLEPGRRGSLPVEPQSPGGESRPSSAGDQGSPPWSQCSASSKPSENSAESDRKRDATSAQLASRTQVKKSKQEPQRPPAAPADVARGVAEPTKPPAEAAAKVRSKTKAQAKAAPTTDAKDAKEEPTERQEKKKDAADAKAVESVEKAAVTTEPVAEPEAEPVTAPQKKSQAKESAAAAAGAETSPAVSSSAPAETSVAEQRLPATPQRRRSSSVQEAARSDDSAGTSGASPKPPSSPSSVWHNGRQECCSICCDDAPANEAVRLPCGHGWYCFSCLKRHAEARLDVGAVDVACPDCNTSMAERTLRRVLPSEVVETLLARSLEQAVSAVGDLYACPTPNCSFRVALEDGDVSRLKCPDCKKTCCLRCGAQPYHRGLSCQEYAEKQKLSAKAKDTGEADLERWMAETGSKRCPTCRAVVTKQNLDKQNSQYAECHKMLCRNCDTKFCFKCLAVLTEKYSCGCTRAEHGFINPKTGRRLNHLKAPKAKAKSKQRK
eukprot:TRINITY_DN40522_c0_g1_i1.p1 TRINITY_DN40522_c0_g1~~TRINITY_DN40522_c0_g1_i1.p1  ORF type:complete len:762 (-),score=194.28 TRINITY_DN40522_c0_g1_i1:74-2359(-)